MEPIPKAEFSIVTRTSAKAWLPELIASAGAEVTETYIDFFTSTIRNRNTRSLSVPMLPCMAYLNLNHERHEEALPGP